MTTSAKAIAGAIPPVFFKTPATMALAEVARLAGAELVDAGRADLPIRGLASLDHAGPHHLAFFDNLKYADQLKHTRAGACLVGARYASAVPDHVAVLRAADPFRAFVAIGRHLHQDALRPPSFLGNDGIAPTAVIHDSARLEDGVVVEAYATIGPDVEIGTGTMIGAHAMIGAGVKIGRNSSIGAGTSLIYCYIGDNVVVHPGCHIGQDGFGYSAGAGGHTKIPQTGRVLIQHDVEIGAGTTIDRGSLRDTVIGEGTKIDNLVQIGHNVYIGRHCLVLAQCGLAGSLTLEDYVALGAKAGLNNHLTIGEGAQVAAMSGVKDDIPPGERWGGIFARPAKQWLREIKVLENLAHGGAAAARRGDKEGHE